MTGIRYVAVTVALIFATPAAAQNDERFEAFGAMLEETRTSTGTRSLSAVIVRDGEIAWEGYYGTYDDEGDIPTVAETTYSIASVTKPIAATAILSEANAGALDIALPMTSDADWGELCAWLTGSDILFGRGGEEANGNVVAAMDCERETSLADMLDMRANGETFVYNPIAFARIDRAIEGAGGRALRDIVRDRVVTPAGMENVALGWHDSHEGLSLRYLAFPHHVIDGRSVKQTISDDDFRASAGIKASPRAIAAFDIAYDSGKLLPSAQRDHLVSRNIGPNGDYRSGWFLEDYGGRRLMWHSGWDPERYSALYLKVPSKNLSLIVLANSESIWWRNSAVRAEVVNSPIAATFLRLFVDEE